MDGHVEEGRMDVYARVDGNVRTDGQQAHSIQCRQYSGRRIVNHITTIFV